MDLRIAVLGGDGIGPEVTAESVKVLDAIGRRYGHEFTYITGPVGGTAIDMTGSALPADTMNIVLGSDAVLFGAVGGPKWDDPAAKVRPEDGILALRKGLGLFANLRPCKVYEQLIDTSPIRPERLIDVDFIIVRELTGGLYFGKPKRRWENSRGRRAVDTLAYSEKEIERVVRIAFELARDRKKRLHSLDKMNVMESSRLWREVATEVGIEYPDVELIHMLADNAAMQIITQPSIFDVIVAENMFGDILSDEAAMLTGSLGLLPSASLGAKDKDGNMRSMYEPVHGSAPDITGKGIANPIATILSFSMALKYSLNLDKESKALDNAVQKVLDDGLRTKDIISKGKKEVSTSEMGDAIIACLQK